MSITIGADPELFVADANNNIVSGIGHVGGSKEKPFPVKGGAVQEDNVLAEFNIDPCKTAKQFCKQVSTVTSELDKILKKAELHTVVKSSHTFEKDALIASGQKAMEFGCDPDTNCWSEEENESPNPYTCLRTAGGHVHIGYDKPTEARSYEIACILDYLLGVPSVLLDDDVERRGMYGQAGACRIKVYGVEYRVLSNFWLGSESLKKWVFDMAVLAESLTLQEVVELYDPLDVFQAINTSNVDLATSISVALENNIKGFYLPSQEA